MDIIRRNIEWNIQEIMTDISRVLLAIYLFFSGIVYGNTIDLNVTAKAEMTDYGCVVIAEVTNNGKSYIGTDTHELWAHFYRIVDGEKVYDSGLTTKDYWEDVAIEALPSSVLVKHGETRTFREKYYFTDDYKPGEYFVDVKIPDCDKVYTFTFTLT